MDHVDAHGGGDGDEDGHEDQLDGRGVHEHAEDQDDDVHDEEEDPLVGRQAEDPGADVLCQLLARDDVADDGGRPDHDARGPHVLDGGLDDVDEVSPPEGAVGEHRDEDGVQGGDGPRLGGCRDSEIDAHQENDRGHQRRDGLEGGDEEGLPDELVSPRVLALIGDDADVDHQGGCQEEGRDHTAHEEGSDRGGAEHRIDDQRDGWREDRAERRRSRRDGAGVFRLVAGRRHRLDLDLAEARRIGDRRSGHAAEEQGAQDIDLAERPAHPSGQPECEVVDHLGDPPRIHDVCREDEEGDGDDDVVGVVGVHHLVDHQAQVTSLYDEVTGGAGEHAEGNRHPEEEDQDEDKEGDKEGKTHFLTSPSMAS